MNQNKNKQQKTSNGAPQNQGGPKNGNKGHNQDGHKGKPKQKFNNSNNKNNGQNQNRNNDNKNKKNNQTQNKKQQPQQEQQKKSQQKNQQNNNATKPAKNSVEKVNNIETKKVAAKQPEKTNHDSDCCPSDECNGFDHEDLSSIPEISLDLQKQLMDIEEELTKVDMEHDVEVVALSDKFNVRRAPMFERRREILKKIPNFWSTTLMLSHALDGYITEEDVQILRDINDVYVENTPTGFTITFGVKEDSKFIENKTFSVDVRTSRAFVGKADAEERDTATRCEEVVFKPNMHPDSAMTKLRDSKDSILKSNKRMRAYNGLFSLFSTKSDMDALADAMGPLATSVFPDALSIFASNFGDDEDESDFDSEGTDAESDEDDENDFFSDKKNINNDDDDDDDDDVDDVNDDDDDDDDDDDENLEGKDDESDDDATE